MPLSLSPHFRKCYFQPRRGSRFDLHAATRAGARITQTQEHSAFLPFVFSGNQRPPSRVLSLSLSSVAPTTPRPLANIVQLNLTLHHSNSSCSSDSILQYDLLHLHCPCRRSSSPTASFSEPAPLQHSEDDRFRINVLVSYKKPADTLKSGAYRSLFGDIRLSHELCQPTDRIPASTLSLQRR